MSAVRGDRVIPILLSVLIHGVLVAALVWGWWQYRNPKPAPATLAIEATVVRNLPPAQPPPPAPPAQQPPAPAPDAALEAQKAREAAAKAQAERDAQAAAQKAADEKAAAEKAAVEKAVAEKAAAEKAAAEQAAQEAEEKRVAAERAAAAKAEAERKAKEAAQRKAQQLAQERAQNETDLRRQLAAEEHLNAVESSPAKAEYLSLITAKINRAWIRPPSAHAGVKCVVHITQVAGGEITRVSVEGCNGDEAVRQSVQTAAYRASPLPAPSDAALFDPNITVTFAPDD